MGAPTRGGAEKEAYKKQEEERNKTPGPSTYEVNFDISKPSAAKRNAASFSFGPYGGPQMAKEMGIKRRSMICKLDYSYPD